MSDNHDLKRLLPPDGNLDFELVGHSARAGSMPVHSFKIRTTLESGERVDITEHVAMTLDRKTNKAGALNEGGMGYYKPDVIAGQLAEALYGQDKYKHSFKVRTEDVVSDEEKHKHDNILGLREAAERSNVEEIQSLVAAGANVNTQNTYGQTPLHLVGQRDYSAGHIASGAAAQALLAAGADPNAQDVDGNTPLHGAMNAPVAVALLEGGADHTIQNRYGDVPLDNQRARMGDAAAVIEIYDKRQALAGAARRNDDLADPEEVMARQSRGRRM